LCRHSPDLCICNEHLFLKHLRDTVEGAQL
jgi:hypothetical protein